MEICHKFFLEADFSSSPLTKHTIDKFPPLDLGFMHNRLCLDWICLCYCADAELLLNKSDARGKKKNGSCLIIYIESRSQLEVKALFCGLMWNKQTYTWGHPLWFPFFYIYPHALKLWRENLTSKTWNLIFISRQYLYTTPSYSPIYSALSYDFFLPDFVWKNARQIFAAKRNLWEGEKQHIESIQLISWH